MISKSQTESFLSIIEKMIEARKKIENNFIIQLPIEMAIVELTELSVQKIPGTFNSAPVQELRQTSGSVKTQETPKKELKNSGQVIIDARALAEKWNEVLAKIKKHNHSLSFILRVCEPRGLSDNRVCLAFKYKFHKDRVDDISIKKIIENVLAEVYGKNLEIEAILDESLKVSEDSNSVSAQSESDKGEKKDANVEVENNNGKSEPIESKEVVNKILETFGGKVVE